MSASPNITTQSFSHSPERINCFETESTVLVEVNDFSRKRTWSNANLSHASTDEDESPRSPIIEDESNKKFHFIPEDAYQTTFHLNVENKEFSIEEHALTAHETHAYTEYHAQNMLDTVSTVQGHTENLTASFAVPYKFSSSFENFNGHSNHQLEERNYTSLSETKISSTENLSSLHTPFSSLPTETNDIIDLTNSSEINEGAEKTFDFSSNEYQDHSYLANKPVPSSPLSYRPPVQTIVKVVPTFDYGDEVDCNGKTNPTQTGRAGLYNHIAETSPSSALQAIDYPTACSLSNLYQPINLQPPENFHSSNIYSSSSTNENFIHTQAQLSDAPDAMNRLIEMTNQNSLPNQEQSLLNSPIDYPEIKEEAYVNHSYLKTVIQDNNKTKNRLNVELANGDLWKKFFDIGTEMIITKAGRRMFPSIKLDVKGLKPHALYVLAVDIMPLDNSRYRYVYHSSQWMAAGTTDACPTPRTYIHPDSPARGDVWMRQVIAFDKLKLTNHEMNKKGHIILHSMHKYQPRIHIIECHGNHPINFSQLVPTNMRIDDIIRDDLTTIIFPECAFTTVTAYQNQQITKLKIDRNPFAKGFRDSSKQWRPKCSNEKIPQPPQPNKHHWRANAAVSSHIPTTDQGGSYHPYYIESYRENHEKLANPEISSSSPSCRESEYISNNISASSIDMNQPHAEKFSVSVGQTAHYAAFSALPYGNSVLPIQEEPTEYNVIEDTSTVGETYQISTGICKVAQTPSFGDCNTTSSHHLNSEGNFLFLNQMSNASTANAHNSA